MDDDLVWLPAWRLHSLYRERAVSPLEVAHQVLRRIERLNTAL